MPDQHFRGRRWRELNPRPGFCSTTVPLPSVPMVPGDTDRDDLGPTDPTDQGSCDEPAGGPTVDRFTRDELIAIYAALTIVGRRVDRPEIESAAVKVWDRLWRV